MYKILRLLTHAYLIPVIGVAVCFFLNPSAKGLFEQWLILLVFLLRKYANFSRCRFMYQFFLINQIKMHIEEQFKHEAHSERI